MKFKLNPTQQITLLLSIYTIGAILLNLRTQVFLHLLATLGFSLILFGIFTFISKKKKNIWNTIISALIIFLVLHYGSDTQDLIYPLIATFVTVFSKFFLELKGLPIINPVVLGLLTTYLLGSLIALLKPPFISWWGTSYQGFFNGYSIPIALILIIIWIVLSLNKWRKYALLVTFLLAHAILIFARTPEFEFLKFTFSDATIYFFAAIMLIEPKSSPMLKSQQFIYAILAAISYNLLAHFNVTHFDLIAIAIANLYFFLARSIKAKPRVA